MKKLISLMLLLSSILSLGACKIIEQDDQSSEPHNTHNYITVTTSPTCTKIGYDTMTCTVCGNTVVCNETAMTEHKYTDYSFDNSHHWQKCSTCDNTTDYAEHTANNDGICIVCEQRLGVTNGILYDEVSSDYNYAIVIKYEGTAANVVIADTYNSLPVKAIHQSSFYGNDHITLVIIPDSVTTIGISAFEDCDALTTVIIGNGLTTISHYAFAFCTNLSTVVIPDNVTHIGIASFRDCSSITSVIIGKSVTSIGSSAFYKCTKLTKIYYASTKDEWSKINIASNNNSELLNASVYYYSETEPTDGENYWHYDENGNIVEW